MSRAVKIGEELEWQGREDERHFRQGMREQQVANRKDAGMF